MMKNGQTIKKWAKIDEESRKGTGSGFVLETHPKMSRTVKND
jgi:hypothetical protein